MTAGTSTRRMARTSVWEDITRTFPEAIRVWGEGVGLLESTFKVIRYFCLQQFTFVGLRRIYHHVMYMLSYDWSVLRLIPFLHEETGKLFPECTVFSLGVIPLNECPICSPFGVVGRGRPRLKLLALAIPYSGNTAGTVYPFLSFASFH